MTAPILEYSPDHPVNADITPRLRATQFGDGYTEEGPDGLNHLPHSYSVTFSERFAANDERAFEAQRDKEQILAFFSERGGYKPFYFTFRNTPEIHLVKCRSWGHVTVPGDLWTIRATFEQDFSEPNLYDYIYGAYPGGPYPALQAMVDFVTGPAGREPS